MSSSPYTNGHAPFAAAEPPAPAPPILGLIPGPPPPDVTLAMTCLRLARRHHVSQTALRAVCVSDRFGELAKSIIQTVPAEREGWPWIYTSSLKGRDLAEAETIEGALLRAIPFVESEPDDPDPDLAPPPERRPFTSGILASVAFLNATYPREFMVTGIITVGQPCIIGGPRKALKTTFAVDLAISIGTATTFLGEFATPRPRRVLFLSGESGSATVQETAKRVCQAKGLTPHDLDGRVFWGFELPKLSNPDDVAELAAYIREHGIEVVIVDPLYLCLLSGNSKLDAANLFDVGPLLQTITSACLDAGATPILIHHLRKNRDNPNAPPELEDLAFAGVQEFARQWILLGRREAYEPGTGDHKLWLAVGGSAGHSGAWAVDVREGVIDDEFAGREWAVTVTKASEARAETAEQAIATKAAKLAEAAKTRDEVARRKLCEDAEDAFAWLRKKGKPVSKTEWRENLGWNSARMGPVVAELESRKRVRTTQFQGAKGRGIGTVWGYEIGDPDECRTMPDYAGLCPDNPALDSEGVNAGLMGGLPPYGGDPHGPSGIPPRSMAKNGASGKADEVEEKSPAFDGPVAGGAR
jgi:hypothetical protein